jgi:rhamnose transport system substrate-binding protein
MRDPRSTAPRGARVSRLQRAGKVLVGVSAAALLLAACSSSPSSPAAPAAKSPSSTSSYTFAFVPKLIGIPYFTSMQIGMESAAKRFGAHFIYEGPTTASVSGQAEDVTTLLSNKKVGAVGVSANSPTALCSLVNQAKAEHVIFFASDSDVSCPNNRLWVEQARAKQIGDTAVDLLGQQIAQIEKTKTPTGDVAIISAGSSATNLNDWIGFMKSELASKYPQLHLLPIEYAGEDPTESGTIASRLLASYPKLKGFIGVASTNVPGIAQAVLAAGLKGKIAVTGETDPNTIRNYVNDGVVKDVVLWNPTTLGYLAGWAVIQMLKDHGKYPFKAVNHVPGISHPIKWYPSRHMLLLGPPLIINKSNINLNF